jgi:spore coat polysaccharide biosynthesis protein SpsF
MGVVAIIQARMGSTRLPGKVLLDLAGRPMLARVVGRARRATAVDEVVVATTTAPEDAAVAALCRAEGWPCVRGSPDDVLDRYRQAAVSYRAHVVVRLTADCPLIDPDVIDEVVRSFLRRIPNVDYASNVLSPRTYPRGLDTEVFSFEALECAWREGTDPAAREHVTPFLYFNPDRFRLLRMAAPADYSAFRWTVDTPADYELVLRIYRHFGHDGFSWQDVVPLFRRHPEWLAINRHVEQKAG